MKDMNGAYKESDRLCGQQMMDVSGFHFRGGGGVNRAPPKPGGS